MKTQFDVPLKKAIEFAQLLVDNELVNEIVDTDENTIIIEVEYQRSEMPVIEELMDLVEEN